jgi:hypothetical protein
MHVFVHILLILVSLVANCLRLYVELVILLYVHSFDSLLLARIG